MTAGAAFRDAGASILVVAFGTRVFGLSPENGAHIWERALEGAGVYPRLHSLPAHVLVLSNRLWCLDLMTGRSVWEAEVSGDTLLCEEPLVFVAEMGEVTCVRLADGKILWHDGFKGKGMSQVALAYRSAVAQLDRNR